MNSIVYEVEFPDGQVRYCTADVIYENIMSQFYSELLRKIPMEYIVYQKKDQALAISNYEHYIATNII